MTLNDLGRRVGETEDAVNWDAFEPVLHSPLARCEMCDELLRLHVEIVEHSRVSFGTYIRTARMVVAQSCRCESRIWEIVPEPVRAQ